MGAWGVGIYDDDTTLDIHDGLVKLIDEGNMPVRRALGKIIEQYNYGRNHSTIVLGLAKEQVRYDILVDLEIILLAKHICEEKIGVEEFVKVAQVERAKILDDFLVELNKFIYIHTGNDEVDESEDERFEQFILERKKKEE